MSSTDVLIYTEDPGAANFVANIPAHLQAQGINATMLAEGLAAKLLENRKIDFESPAAKSAEELLRQYNPRLLIVGTSENQNSLGLSLIDSAKKLGIETVAAVDMAVNADKRFVGQSQNPLQHLPHWVLVPDKASLEAFVKLGCAQHNVIVTGHPHFDYLEELKGKFAKQSRAELRQAHFPKAPADRPILVFIAEPHSIVNPQISLHSPEFTLHGRGSSQFRTIIVLEEVVDALSELPVKPYVVVRLHPKNQVEEFAAHTTEIEELSHGNEPLNVIAACDLVVGMSSMLVAESAFLNKPTLSVLTRRFERDWIPAGASDYLPIVQERQELRTVLARWIKQWSEKKQIEVAPIERATSSMQQVVSFIDGRLRRQAISLKGANVTVKSFNRDCINDEYISWLNDKELMKHSRHRDALHTPESCLEFLSSFSGTDNLFFSVQSQETGEQIGTMTAYIDRKNGSADVGILIGKPGQGTGTEAWGLVLNYLFQVQKLQKVTAGCLDVNVPMAKLARHWGMKPESRLPSQAADVLRFGLEAANWEQNKAALKI